ncbi:hypothetical protein [Nonomuraea lactucae]|uniref:hypothetical protein n=1 Tax=Nonomuraea lactucae TaxID=2249762 RepID=UPI000DE38A4C|nr:hypothetical protein [Nonomuraea lactucae]
MDDALFYMFVVAAAATGYAARFIPGKAAYSIPVAIGVLANSPKGQAELAAKWETSAEHLGRLHTALSSTKKSGQPREWDAGDREAFDKSVADLMERVVKGKDIVHNAAQTLSLSSKTSEYCAYFCASVAVIMMMAARYVMASGTTGPAGAAAGQLAAQAVAARVSATVAGVLNKQLAVGGTAGGIMLLGAGWHELQLHMLKNQVLNPEGKAPEFEKVKMDWAKDA